MTLRKIFIDNSVRYIPKGEKTREITQNTIKNKSTSKKQNRNISQDNKKFLNNVAAQGFGFLKGIMSRYF